MVQWLGPRPFTAGGTGSIPGRELRFCMMLGAAGKKNKTKQVSMTSHNLPATSPIYVFFSLKNFSKGLSVLTTSNFSLSFSETHSHHSYQSHQWPPDDPIWRSAPSSSLPISHPYLTTFIRPSPWSSSSFGFWYITPSLFASHSTDNFFFSFLVWKLLLFLIY